jgi:putative ABC transport system substrate-binding protein
MDRWRRRQFVQSVGVAGLGLLAWCGQWPGQARTPKAPRLGILSPELDNPYLDDLQQALADLGYTVGRNVLIELRHAAEPEALPALAAELVNLPVDLMLTQGQTATLAARRATDTIPIVQMGGGGDLVEAGLIASLAHPGGNVTGLTYMVPQLSGKRLELLKETVPSASRVGIVWGAGILANATTASELQNAARSLSLELESLELHEADAIEAALGAATRARVEALVVVADPVTLSRPQRIVDIATQSRLPAMYGGRPFMVAGGLMTYGPNLAAQPRRAAYYVDRILKGTKPADLPVEQPMTFEFIINLKTAQALGLTIPEHVLLQATEVIQ